MNKIVVLIPCHNEEEGIANVINSIPTTKLNKLGYEVEILVIDNNSTDRTGEIAKSLGAHVIFEKRKGKGNAIKTGFESISKNTKYVIMMDGDDTYKGGEIPRMIEPLESGFADVIVGSRLGGKMSHGALKFQNRVANWVYAFLVRQFYGANITDVLSGYMAWKRKALDGLKLHLETDGFAIEMEMITKMVKLGYQIYAVPITYDVRQGTSKIESFKDGFRILKMFFDNLNWHPSNTDKNKSTFKVGIW